MIRFEPNVNEWRSTLYGEKREGVMDGENGEKYNDELTCAKEVNKQRLISDDVDEINQKVE